MPPKPHLELVTPKLLHGLGEAFRDASLTVGVRLSKMPYQGEPSSQGRDGRRHAAENQQEKRDNTHSGREKRGPCLRPKPQPLQPALGLEQRRFPERQGALFHGMAEP